MKEKISKKKIGNLGYKIKSYRWLASSLVCFIGIAIILLLQVKQWYQSESTKPEERKQEVIVIPKEYYDPIEEIDDYYLYENNISTLSNDRKTTGAIQRPSAIRVMDQWSYHTAPSPEPFVEIPGSANRSEKVDKITEIELILTVIERLFDKIFQIVLFIIGIISAIKGVMRSNKDDEDIDPNNNDV